MASLTAEVFAIGSELCFGKIYDTNSFWIADQLTRRGVRVQRITCLTDDMENIISALKDSFSRKPTFVFVSGGLGPTDDDLTIEALSRVTGVLTCLEVDGLRWMAEKEGVSFEKLDKRLNKMAVSLVGAQILRNPVGWAPATHLKFRETDVYALPGPPTELKEFFNRYISKTISNRTGRKSLSARFVATMYEEELSPFIGQIAGKDQDIYIKALVSEYKADVGLPLEILVFGTSEEECGHKMARTVHELTKLVSSQGRILRRSDQNHENE